MNRRGSTFQTVRNARGNATRPVSSFIAHTPAALVRRRRVIYGSRTDCATVRNFAMPFRHRTTEKPLSESLLFPSSSRRVPRYPRETERRRKRRERERDKQREIKKKEKRKSKRKERKFSWRADALRSKEVAVHTAHGPSGNWQRAKHLGRRNTALARTRSILEPSARKERAREIRPMVEFRALITT